MGTSAARRMTAVEWGLLVLLAAIWGGSFFLGKVAVAELPPFTIVFLRVSLAAIALTVFMRVSRPKAGLKGGTWVAFTVLAVLNNAVPFSLIYWGQTQIGAGLAAILNSTTPLFTAILANFYTRDERLTPGRVIGVVVGILGVAWMMGPSAVSGLGSSLWAQVAILGAAVSYAVGGIYARRLSAVPPLVIARGQLTASSIIMLPVVVMLDRPWELSMPGATTIAAVVTIALVCTAAAYGIYFRILANAGATNATLVTLLVPVSAIALGVLVLGEVLTSGQIIGMGLITLGLMIIDGRAVELCRPKRSRRAA